MHHAFASGFAIGLAYAVPIGPVAIICMRRTLAANWVFGIASGLGSATAIAVYSSIVVVGASLVIKALQNYQFLLQLFSGFFLCYLGFTVIAVKPSKLSSIPIPESCLRCYITTFMLAFFTALLDLTFPIYVLNQLSHIRPFYFLYPVHFSTGVLVSEVMWWLLFCSICWKLKSYLSFSILRWINYLSGGAIALFGFVTIFRSVFFSQYIFRSVY